MIFATIAVAAAYVEPLAPRPAVAARTSQKPCRLCADEPPAPSGDWRDFRARLVQQDQQGDSESADSSFVYETPLIERGTVILGGTQQDFGFALRQPLVVELAHCAPRCDSLVVEALCSTRHFPSRLPAPVASRYGRFQHRVEFAAWASDPKQPII